MTITIDKDTALEHLRAVVEEHGEEQKAACQYAIIRDAVQSPCCIVGQVFSRAGIPTEILRALDDSGSGSDGTDVISLDERGVLERYGIILTRAALATLKVAQQKQDAGYTWGFALAQAEKVAAAPGAFYGPGQADCVACQGDVVTP